MGKLPGRAEGVHGPAHSARANSRQCVLLSCFLATTDLTLLSSQLQSLSFSICSEPLPLPCSRRDSRASQPPTPPPRLHRRRPPPACQHARNLLDPRNLARLPRLLRRRSRRGGTEVRPSRLRACPEADAAFWRVVIRSAPSRTICRWRGSVWIFIGSIWSWWERGSVMGVAESREDARQCAIRLVLCDGRVTGGADEDSVCDSVTLK